MKSASWGAVRRQFEASAKEFAIAKALFDDRRAPQWQGALEALALDRAFMQAMRAGHTSLENGLQTILALLHNPLPDNLPNWHQDIVEAAFAVDEEFGSILPTELHHFVDETRRARSLASRGYVRFEIAKAAPSSEAAGALADHLMPALDDFITRVDPANGPNKSPGRTP